METVTLHSPSPESLIHEEVPLQCYLTRGSIQTAIRLKQGFSKFPHAVVIHKAYTTMLQRSNLHVNIWLV
jgi:hypothetical protein